jgi:DNA repair exonuclease SbcCD ATPase subunit
MGRVCYRFIDSPYRMEFFVDENRTAYSGNDRIRAALDQYGVDYSRIIYTYDEYRNILYGNGAGPEMSRYSLMESKQYQNIPRTIQNVLLNSKLDAEFIKKTIISSINEDETAIDLNTYKEHLKNFETRLRDIEEFQKRETQKQAKEITSLSAQVSRQQTALVQGCRELAATYRLTESQLPKAEEQKHQAEKARTALLARRQELQEQSRQRCDKMQEALAILNNELQKAQQKEKEYARRQIEEIMERSARKEEWKNKQQGLQEEQRILTSHYTEISTKYKSLIQSLDEQWNRIHEAKIKQLEGLNNTFNARIEEARRQHEAATEALYQEYEQLSQQLHPERSSKQNELTALDYQMQLCRKETFFEAEQEELKHRIQFNISGLIEQIPISCKRARSQIANTPSADTIGSTREILFLKRNSLRISIRYSYSHTSMKRKRVTIIDSDILSKIKLPFQILSIRNSQNSVFTITVLPNVCSL